MLEEFKQQLPLPNKILDRKFQYVSHQSFSPTCSNPTDPPSYQDDACRSRVFAIMANKELAGKVHSLHVSGRNLPGKGRNHIRCPGSHTPHTRCYRRLHVPVGPCPWFRVRTHRQCSLYGCMHLPHGSGAGSCRRHARRNPRSSPHQSRPNAYTLGKIGGHNIVVAVLPKIGNSAAATVAMQLLNSFPSI